MNRSARFAVVFFAAAFLVAGFAVLPSFSASPRSSSFCRIAIFPRQVSPGGSVNIVVLVFNGAANSVYSGVARVRILRHLPAGSAEYSIATNARGFGAENVVYPSGFTGGTTARPGVYQVVVSLASGYYYTPVACQAFFRVA